MGSRHKPETANRQGQWRIPARQMGLSRRQLMWLLSAGGATAGLFAPVASREQRPWVDRPVAASGRSFVKDTTQHFYSPGATIAASRWWEFTTDVIPYDRLFIRNRYPTPIVDKAAWTLTVTGDAIERPLQLRYGDLTRMRSLTALRYHECFGNGGRTFGLVGQVEWHYVPIGEILKRVRPKRDAVHALLWSGVDGLDTGRPIDVSELRARPDAIGIAYGMNGKDLPPDHGGPARAIVPGWGAAASVKWLTEIRISSHRFWTRMSTREEVLIGPAYPAETPGPNDAFTAGTSASDIRGRMGTWETTKSHLDIPLLLAPPRPSPTGYPLRAGERPVLTAGRRTMTGYAYSPWGIQSVDYTIDEGRTWHRAAFAGPANREDAWVRFRFDWDATPGEHVLMTRATDKRGNVQPANASPNALGLLDNGIPRFEVRVA